ncbi:MAG: substrate-binding domain-containing protein [Sphingobacterium sp.]
MNSILKSGIFAACLLVSSTATAQEVNQAHRFDPPWNSPPVSAVEFTVPGINNVPDLYGDIVDPQLVVFFAGNQFMCVDELLETFKKKHPEIQRIFVETLPPGILAEQIKGGSLTLGNLRITHKPDVYTAGQSRIQEMNSYFSKVAPYAYNGLSLMVEKGNPKAIASLRDLARKDLRISMPNPAWEGIGRQIETAYHKTGGRALHQAVMEEKVSDGTTYLTQIHHRESPLRLLYGHSDVAPVWTSEVVYQEMIGHPVEEVSIAEEHNIRATYMAGRLKDAPHQQAADLFMEFMTSEDAKAIYRRYGFQTE